MLPRANRLKNTRDFDRAYKKGEHIKGRYGKFAVFRREDENPVRIGIVVTAKLGNAVVRNRVTRMVREVFRRQLPRMNCGYDISFILWDISFINKNGAEGSGAEKSGSENSGARDSSTANSGTLDRDIKNSLETAGVLPRAHD